MAYLNDWDKKIPNLDVVEDYRSERQQIQAYRGKNMPFSFGDVSPIDYSQPSLSLFFICSTSLKFCWVVSMIRLILGMKRKECDTIHFLKLLSSQYLFFTNKINLLIQKTKIFLIYDLSILHHTPHNVYRSSYVDDYHLVVWVENRLNMTNKIHVDI